MFMWTALLIVMSLLNPIISFSYWWYAFGIWPRNWWAFVLFSFIFYIQGELAKKAVKEMAKQYGGYSS